MKFSELQQILKQNYGIDHLADIARTLGVSPQAVSNWKSRDRVPYKYVLNIRKQLEESDTQVSDQIENNTSDANQVLPQYIYSQHLEESQISFIDIVLSMAKRLRIIIITPIIFCILMIIHVQFRVQPIYQSTAKIMYYSGSDNTSRASSIAAQFGLTLPASQGGSQWVIGEIVRSRTIARTMLNRKFDTEKFGKQKPLLQILTYGNEEPTVGQDTLIKSGIKDIIGMIDIKENGSFYDLKISASEPILARDIILALIEEIDNHQLEYNKSKMSETRTFIEERIVNTENELQTAEEDLRDFRDRNRRINNSPSLLLEQQRLSREVAVLTSVFTTLKQQLETVKIEEVKDSDYVVVLDPPEAPMDRSSPNKRKMVFYAGFFGLIVGIIIGFIMEYLEKSYDKEREKVWKLKSLVINNIKVFIPYYFRKNS